LKKLAFLVGALGLGATALLVASHKSHAADHIDAPAATATPMGDIADVYAWMTSDKTKLNLVMTISPADDGSRHFAPNILYVFHVTSYSAYAVPAVAGTETKVICQFMSDTNGTCWVGDKEFVTGNPNATAGIASSDNKIRLFAGHRSDPFFFNLQGFRNTVKLVEAASGANLVAVDGGGCPHAQGGVTNAQLGGLLQGCLFGDPNAGAGTVAACDGALSGVTGTADAPCSTSSPDCFASLNVIAIVLQVDVSFFATTTNPILGVWASTHMAM
jgi:hypothetical protein